MLMKLSNPGSPEHHQIEPVLKDISFNNYKFAYYDKHAAAVLFSTSLNARQIHARFDGVLLNDDQRMIIEVGHDWYTYGLDSAAAYLNRHVPRLP